MGRNEEPKRHGPPRKRYQPKTTTERGYGWDWQKLRLAWLNDEPRYCVMCAVAGKLIPATVVDHIIPHKGNESLRLDWDNLQGLCVKCHTDKTLNYDGGLGNDIKPFPKPPFVPLDELLS